MMSPLACASCTMPDGRSAYPYYGVAPHICFDKIPNATIGQSVTAPKEAWPANFEEDPEAPGLGTYTHCLECGR